MVQVCEVQTEKAERLLKALCNHFAQKTTASYENGLGQVMFRGGKCEMRAENGKLLFHIEAPDPGLVTQLKMVMESHLQRFSPQETFVFNWQEAA